ncbi:ATP-grasp domain-containing protein [Bacillus sp. NEB1478]|uniref:ATP-grasp domain-containing protein n=1 Tax=Bacillus sp. NEB1478 TaxID=3073816 RepID=UPI002872E57C|nr:ATP-grasp domain-containing protein [Bacillus sp. NEB1478]WNB92524.1 ATP-grasp domain-containing protein [Bacillus sp. NEB1478]
MKKHIAFLESNLSGSGFEGLKVAKEMGYHVTFLTRDLQRYLDVPGGADYFNHYVDDIRYCETNTVEDVLHEIHKEIKEKTFSAFLTLGEYDVPIAAKVAKHLGLPTLDPTAATIARNKYLTRVYCEKADVPIPRFKAVRESADLQEIIGDIGFPCILKPVDETSSTDVVKCNDLEELISHFESIKNKAENTRGQSRSNKELLVEEYMVGYEVSIEVLTHHGKHVVIGVTDKFLSAGKHFVEVGHSFPSGLPEKIVKECEKVAVDSLDAIGFNMGASHIEVKVTKEGVKLIEINARPGGDKVPTLVELSMGYSIVKDVLKLYLNETPDLFDKQQVKKGAAIRFITAYPGVIQHLSGIEEVNMLTGIQQFVMSASVGTVVKPLDRNGHRLGHVLVVADSPYEASRIADTAIGQLSIETNTLSKEAAYANHV